MNEKLAQTQVVDRLKERVRDLQEANTALEARVFSIRRRLEIALDEMERTKLGAYNICQLRTFLLGIQ